MITITFMLGEKYNNNSSSRAKGDINISSGARDPFEL
jgi:hypothetical protein